METCALSLSFSLRKSTAPPCGLKSSIHHRILLPSGLKLIYFSNQYALAEKRKIDLFPHQLNPELCFPWLVPFAFYKKIETPAIRLSYTHAPAFLFYPITKALFLRKEKQKQTHIGSETIKV